MKKGGGIGGQVNAMAILRVHIRMSWVGYLHSALWMRSGPIFKSDQSQCGPYATGGRRHHTDEGGIALFVSFV